MSLSIRIKKSFHPNQLISLLDSCKSMRELKQLHAQIIQQQVTLSPYEFNSATTKLVSFLAISPYGNLDYAKVVFNHLQKPDIFTSNTLIRGLALSNKPFEAIELYVKVLQKCLKPNNFTYPFVIKACTESLLNRNGVSVHTHVFKFGLESDCYIQSSLIHMYANGKDLDAAKQVFDKCSDGDFVCWNAMIDGYVKFGEMELAQLVFGRMVCKDVVSWNTMINGYAIFGNIEEAKKLFDEMPKRNVISWNSMLAGYIKCGDFEGAQGIFHKMPLRDVVSWNSMLACYVQSGKSSEALAFFNEMRAAGVKPTESTVVSLSSACAHIGALDQASHLHSHINEQKIAVTTIVGTALVDMYAKCGSISLATQVFYSIEHKDVLTWNTIITAMAMHGHAEEALQHFEEMQQAGVCPDDITFVAVLSACSHAGLVEEGQRLLGCMRSMYGIHPKVEHYGCLIDLLSRAGHLVEAVELIESMPMEPNSSAWGALLGGCRIHGNIEVGELVGKHLLEIQPHHSGRYVLLSNIYAAAKRWDDARGVRKRMKTKGVTKVPGISMIELNGIMHQFLSGDQSHPESDNIYRKWSEISARLKGELAYSPDTVQVLFDIEEEEKEQALSIHSEKLAIAFGFLHMGQKDIIRIVKNLRVCRDCHSVSKLISKVYAREIIVRDRNRFHHFKNGECSCTDYW
ncbi:hypothetical protein AQUCO_04900072v1 [Aquilegia coerulea]|uniref:DYW domain-containing protein n=1 Tax=Aquilegia coerulea TaxID=218851 RepID=A0A2G5CJQ4_AQUCA|nr:hypothetical protein AQUCO_04900072v1 [Aquilegia coerulea]